MKQVRNVGEGLAKLNGIRHLCTPDPLRFKDADDLAAHLDSFKAALDSCRVVKAEPEPEAAPDTSRKRPRTGGRTRTASTEAAEE